MKTLAHSTPERIVEAFELFVVGGGSNPPTLPEFRKAVDDLHKQDGLMVDHQRKEIEGRRTDSVATNGFEQIARILGR